MRAISIAALWVFTMAGCAGGDPTPEEQLAGAWAADVGGYAFGFTFDDANGYTLEVIAELDSGGLGVDGEVGDYDVPSKGRLHLVPRQESCKTADGSAETDRYEISGNTLTLARPDVAVVLKKVPSKDPSLSGVVVFGCWNGDDTFTPGKLQKI